MFVGNNNNNVTELGSTNFNSGGVFELIKDNKFESFKYLPIPAYLNARELISLGGDLYLVVSNNNYSYLFYNSKLKR